MKTVPLPEVLHLLADTSKSGELSVTGQGTGGRFWFDDGRYTGFEVGRCEEAVDALFELLRIEDGEFVFDSGATLPDTAHSAGVGGSDIRPSLEEAQARFREWTDIVAVVPSLRHHVTLVTDTGRDELQLSGDQWALAVAIGEGRCVQDVLDLRHLPEFDGCKAVKGMVDAGLATIAEPVEAATDHPAVEGVGVDEMIGDVMATGHEEHAEPADVVSSVEADDLVVHENAYSSARDAITALIQGLATDPAYGEAGADDDHPESDVPSDPDGLVDRGPWTSSELASLDNATAEPDQASEDDDEDGKGAEPLNRGLLLKFLSSVRS